MLHELLGGLLGGFCMTDEQWEIVNELRMLALGHGGPCCAKAANEIEKLAAKNKDLRDKLMQYVAKANAEFFYASFPERRES
jgi:hypothetical protein